jgi:hypothetical protein
MSMQHPFAPRIWALIEEARSPGPKRDALVGELADLLEQVTKGYAARLADAQLFGEHIRKLQARYARYRLRVWRLDSVRSRLHQK